MPPGELPVKLPHGVAGQRLAELGPERNRVPGIVM
jgi:hypothetical protein